MGKIWGMTGGPAGMWDPSAKAQKNVNGPGSMWGMTGGPASMWDPASKGGNKLVTDIRAMTGLPSGNKIPRGQLTGPDLGGGLDAPLTLTPTRINPVLRIGRIGSGRY